MSLYECEMSSIRGGVFIGGWETKFESFKKSIFLSSNSKTTSFKFKPDIVD
jgi:hypothetical protein